jgi:outer membrane protein insertion porin family/translocation and assembly module TamA
MSAPYNRPAVGVMRANSLSSALAGQARLAVAPALLAGCSSIPAGRSAVDSVRIVNARQLGGDAVTEKLSTTATPKFLGLFRGVVYDYEVFDASALQRDLARVERYYIGHGFLEAHARAGRVVRASSNDVRVEIVVDEGTPTLNQLVRIDGLDALPDSVAAAVRGAASSALPTGARFDEDGYAQAKVAVVRALTDRGYAYATVTGDAQIDLAAHTVDYAFSVKPGPTAVYGAITIVGLDPDGGGPAPQEIDEAPLRRALKLEPGEPYSTDAIDAATQALLDLEVLSAVQIVPTMSEPPSSVIPLTVKVEPAKLWVLRLGGGVELDEIKTEAHALVGWEDHDFLGDLRDFSVDFKPGVVLYPTRIDNLVSPTNWLPEERLRLQLRQPGFLEPRTTLFVRPELNVYPMLVEPNPDPTQPVVGYVEPRGAMGVDHRFGKHFIVSLAHNVQGEVPFAYIPSLPIAQPLPTILLSYPQLITTLDYRNSTVHPHAGFYLINDLEVAGLGGSARDIRVQPEVRGYVPIARRVTFAARSQLGFLFAQNYGDYVQKHLSQPPSASPLPGATSGIFGAVDRDIEIVYFRGFFSGGPSSNRGFPLRGIAPHGVVPFLDPASASTQVALGCVPGQPGYDVAKCSVPIGGFTQWEASMEMRFDVSGPFGTAVFCDAGDVSALEVDLRLDHLHLSCGAGARYDTPVGPLRLDLGYRIQPLQVLGYPNETAAAAHDPTEGTQPLLLGIPLAVSFGIGEAF